MREALITVNLLCFLLTVGFFGSVSGQDDEKIAEPIQLVQGGSAEDQLKLESLPSFAENQDNSFTRTQRSTSTMGAAFCNENSRSRYAGAFDFGLKIQNLIWEKDLAGLFNLRTGELLDGPRRSFAMSKSFDEIFDTQWVNKILSDIPPCDPWGWRGFYLGGGGHYVKFDYFSDRGEWLITSIVGATEEEIGIPSVGWFVGNKLLHSACFGRRNTQEDTLFRSLKDQFEIADADYEQFSSSPGEFFGREIFDNNNALIRNIDSCALTDLSFTITRGQVRTEYLSEHGYRTEYSSRVIREFDSDKCTTLAPNIGAECVQSYLVEVGDYGGGSMGWWMSYGIYGLFQLEDVGLSVVPLRYFGLNTGLNFIDNY